MFDEYNKLLNCKETLRSNLKTYIEAFVKYYGEDKREEIEEKFSNALLIAYRSPDSLKRIIYQLKQFKTDSLKHEFFRNIDTIYTSDDLLKGYLYESPQLMPISDIKDFINLYKLDKEGRKKEFIKKGISSIKNYLPDFNEDDLLYVINNQELQEKYSNIPGWIKNNIVYFANISNAEIEYVKKYAKIENLLKMANENITIENFGDYQEEKEIKNLYTLIERFDSQVQDFNDYILSIDNYIQEDKKRENIHSELATKYYKDFIKENIDLIPIEKRGKLDNFLNDENETYIHNDAVSKVFSYSLKGLSILDSFSDEADKILEENKYTWKIQQIKKDRLEYFNILGINIDGDYEDYINNPDVQKKYPSKERLNKFIESKNNYINRFNNEYYTSLDSHKELRNEIDSLGLLNKDDLFDVSIYEKEGTFVTPNIRKNKSGYELFALVGIYCGGQNDYLDAHVVHELNHLYEMSLIDANELEYTTTCGWESFTDSIITENSNEVNTIMNDRDLRSYELFNEITNELIAQEISEIMNKNNMHVFNSERTAKIKGGTSYESTFFLVKDFFKEYKDKIIQSRKGGHIEIIWNEVGKENFDELNDLFKIFNDNFSGMRIYSVLDDLRQNKDNEQTRVLKNLTIKRDEILEKMKNYKSLNDENKKTLY